MRCSCEGWSRGGRGGAGGEMLTSAVSADRVDAAVLEDEDINEAISTPEMGSWEGVIEVDFVTNSSCSLE